MKVENNICINGNDNIDDNGSISNDKIIKDNNNIDKIGDNETNDAICY